MRAESQLEVTCGYEAGPPRTSSAAAAQPRLGCRQCPKSGHAVGGGGLLLAPLAGRAAPSSARQLRGEWSRGGRHDAQRRLLLSRPVCFPPLEPIMVVNRRPQRRLETARPTGEPCRPRGRRPMTALRKLLVARRFAQHRFPSTESSSVCIHGGPGGREDAESSPGSSWTATSGASHRHVWVPNPAQGMDGLPQGTTRNLGRTQHDTPSSACWSISQPVREDGGQSKATISSLTTRVVPFYSSPA